MKARLCVRMPQIGVIHANPNPGRIFWKTRSGCRVNAFLEMKTRTMNSSRSCFHFRGRSDKVSTPPACLLSRRRGWSRCLVAPRGNAGWQFALPMAGTFMLAMPGWTLSAMKLPIGLLPQPLARIGRPCALLHARIPKSGLCESYVPGVFRGEKYLIMRD